AAEEAALTEAATVDEAAARRAAVESAGGGEAVSAELEEEAGYVVWDVTVRTSDGSMQDVTVDAGDATVLGSQPDDDVEDDPDGEADGD
ncbi:MAG: PepSY domain-containing protein, partial [Actinomycetes bacterium]